MISKPEVEGMKKQHREKSCFLGLWSDVMPHPEGLGKQGPEVHRSCVATWAYAVDYRLWEVGGHRAETQAWSVLGPVQKPP